MSDPVADAAEWAEYERLRAIDAVVARGVRLELHPFGEGVSDSIRRTGDFYEAEILDYLRAAHPRHRTIVDAGAMIGNHSCYFAAFLAHDAIAAFEPVPDNFALLVRNTRPFPTVERFPLALTDGSRRLVRMCVDRANMGACRVEDDGELPVPAMTLDSFDLGPVTLLKVDVEDHERELLDGARRTIARWRPLVLIEDWSHGGIAELLRGYVLEREWAFTYLYRWPGP